jgi:uncharacterized protein
MKHPVMHFEIMGHDAPKLRRFYADVFGWKIADPTPGSPVEYSLIDPVPGLTRGIMGGIGKAPEGYDGHVTFYVVVDDVEAAFAKIEAHGGTRMMGPDKVPNGPIIGLFRDPEGRTVGIVDPAGDMRGAPMELVPFVFFNGRCREALEFYTKVFDGKYEVVMEEDGKIHYARFVGTGIAFEAGDGSRTDPAKPDEGNVSLSLNHVDPARAKEVFDALSEEGNVIHAFGDAEWGGKFGVVHDRFGNEWFVTSR